MRKRIHSDPQNICTPSVRSYKITKNITLHRHTRKHPNPNDTPFPAQRTADKLLPAGNSQQEHGSIHTHTRLFSSVDFLYFYTSSVLSSNFLRPFSFLFSPLFSYLFFSDSLSLINRKPHRMQSVSGAGMIGQWEAGCH